MKLTRILFIALLGFTLYACGGDDFDCETLELNIGDACDDGDSSTENDTVTAGCNCVGTAAVDCPDSGLNVGDPCDDGDDATMNDVIDADCNCTGTAVSEDITYTNTVKAILDSSCATTIACHASGSVASFTMSTYDESIAVVNNGRILGTINHEGGFSPMPKNGDKLDQALIDDITEWINSGTPE